MIRQISQLMLRAFMCIGNLLLGSKEVHCQQYTAVCEGGMCNYWTTSIKLI
jgi:hypothetical protein